MLESNLRRILKAEGTSGTELTKHIERARRCFHGLFETGAENRELTGRHLSIKKKVMEVMEKTTTIGGYERVLALNDFSFPSFDRPLFSGASLILVAEGEEDIMADTSPTLALLKDGAGREKLFPRAKVRTVTSARAADPVPHASLIFHQDCYNPHIETWYDRLAAPRLFAVV